MRIHLALCILAAATSASAESPVVLDANGNLLGSYVGEAVDCGFGCPDLSLRIVSTTGYVFGRRMTDGSFVFAAPTFAYPGPGEVFFESENCTGQGYYSAGVPPTTLTGGFVFQSRLGDLYYSPKTATSGLHTRGSYAELPLGCYDDPGNSQVPAIPVLPNNPNVTGVPNTVIPGPLTIGQAVVPRAMLRDGFENPQASMSSLQSVSVA